jgi:hypothetical protein
MADQLVFYHSPVSPGRIERRAQRPAFERAHG